MCIEAWSLSFHMSPSVSSLFSYKGPLLLVSLLLLLTNVPLHRRETWNFMLFKSQYTIFQSEELQLKICFKNDKGLALVVQSWP